MLPDGCIQTPTYPFVSLKQRCRQIDVLKSKQTKSHVSFVSNKGINIVNTICTHSVHVSPTQTQ